MRRFLTLVVFLTATIAAATADNRPIQVDALPNTAQHFIKKHFPQQRVVFATIDSGMFDTDYEARLDNGTKLDFDRQGVWKEIENEHGLLPESVIPQYALDYVKANFPGRSFVKIERDNRKVEVELNNDLEIVFDKHGKVIHIDD